MQEFERLTGFAGDEYWIEAAAGGPAVWTEESTAGRFAYDHGARVMAWASHGDNCGYFPDVTNDELSSMVEQAMRARMRDFPEAEHIALFAHDGGVELLARQAPQ
jgi:hypothetical protein